jgi:squalene-associated FAD-dependent desaturase
MPTPSQPTVAVVGGGLAGLAAACALADSGFKVRLFEKRPFLGGRASSWEHPGTGEVVDNCQHVLFRCCTNLLEFYDRIGVPQQIRWYDTMTFIEPGGRSTALRATPLLPAPLHIAPSLLGFPFLTAADKLALGRAMLPLMLGELKDDGRTFQQWLVEHGQTRGAIENFWKPVLISALSEDLDRVSISSAARIIRLYMKSPPARHMGVPTVPLTDLYNAAGDYIRARGGTLLFRQPVEGFTADPSRIRLHLREQLGNQPGAPFKPDFGLSGEVSPVAPPEFNFLVLALPYDALDRVLPDSPESAPLREQISHFENSPITGIHLWFDRQISDLDHAVLLDRTIQWMFHKSRLQPMRTNEVAQARQRAAQDEQEGHDFSRAEDNDGPPMDARLTRSRDPNLNNPYAVGANEPMHNRGRAALQGRVSVEENNRALAPAEKEPGSYIELVVSSSKSLIEKSRAEIVELALAEVREFFPAARSANLIKSTVIKEVNATYSPRPGIDAHRPSATTAWPCVFLAGDWTSTGWPATMEGAVRSGYLAAEAILRAARRPREFISPDLPPTGLMRLFS